MDDVYLELNEADLDIFGQLDKMCCELGRVYDVDCLDAKKLAPLVASHMDLRENLAEMLRHGRELSLDEICNKLFVALRAEGWGRLRTISVVRVYRLLLERQKMPQ